MIKSSASKVCPVCGATFTRPKGYSKTQWRNHKTCGKPCGNELIRRNWKRVIPPLSERFLKKVKKFQDGCWEWTGATNTKGYGQIRVGEKKGNALAHRVAWFLEYGKWPELHVLHRCDNSKCVRISHLFEGTQKDNMMDASIKGRIHGLRHVYARHERRVLAAGGDPETQRICSECHKLKSLQDFGIRPSDFLGHRRDCKACNCARTLRYMEKKRYDAHEAQP
jgi:hypothetical protein